MIVGGLFEHCFTSFGVTQVDRLYPPIKQYIMLTTLKTMIPHELLVTTY